MSSRSDLSNQTFVFVRAVFLTRAVLLSSGTMTITTTLPLPTCPLPAEIGVEEGTEAATPTLLTTTVTRTTTITTAMTITTTAVATMTPTMGTMTSRPQAGGGAAAGAHGADPPRPEDVAARGHPEGGQTSPSVAGQDQAVAGAAQEEACSWEGEEGYVVHGVAAVEM